MFKKFRSFFLEENQGRVKLSQRAVVFFFCIVISSSFWLLSALSEEYNSRLNIPLQYTEIAGSFVLTEDPPSELMVEVRGTGFELLGEQWSLDNNPLQLNLNRAKSSSRLNTYYIPTSDLRTKVIRTLDANLNLRYISPDTLYFKTEIRHRKRVPVLGDIQISFENGYNMRSDYSFSPDSVWVSGPITFIDTIKAVVTEKLQLQNQRDSLQQKIALKNFGIDGVSIEPKAVDLLVPVEKFTEKELSIRIDVKNKYDNRIIKTFPNEIEVTFLVPLSKYEYLDTSVVNARVYFTEADLDKKKLKVELEGTPPYAKLMRQASSNVEFIIKE